MIEKDYSLLIIDDLVNTHYKPMISTKIDFLGFT